eukprot:6196836-Pleurochrysis_carterae.AAC.3
MVPVKARQHRAAARGGSSIAWNRRQSEREGMGVAKEEHNASLVVDSRIAVSLARTLCRVCCVR